MKQEVLISFFAQIMAKETLTQELVIELYAKGDADKRSDLLKQSKLRYQELLSVYMKELYGLSQS